AAVTYLLFIVLAASLRTLWLFPALLPLVVVVNLAARASVRRGLVRERIWLGLLPFTLEAYDSIFTETNAYCDDLKLIVHFAKATRAPARDDLEALFSTLSARVSVHEQGYIRTLDLRLGPAYTTVHPGHRRLRRKIHEYMDRGLVPLAHEYPID